MEIEVEIRGRVARLLGTTGLSLRLWEGEEFDGVRPSKEVMIITRKDIPVKGDS